MANNTDAFDDDDRSDMQQIEDLNKQLITRTNTKLKNLHVELANVKKELEDSVAATKNEAKLKDEALEKVKSKEETIQSMTSEKEEVDRNNGRLTSALEEIQTELKEVQEKFVVATLKNTKLKSEKLDFSQQLRNEQRDR